MIAVQEQAMARNQKLTGILKDRRITEMQSQGGEMTIRFDDGSTMSVQTAGSAVRAMTGGRIRAVRQQDTTLSLDFEDGATLEIQTAAPASSVLVRDKEHTLEYAD